MYIVMSLSFGRFPQILILLNVQISFEKFAIICDPAESYTLRIQVEELKAGTFTNKYTRKELVSATLIAITVLI